MLRDKRLLKSKFKRISRDSRKALTYLDYKARVNFARKRQNFSSEELIEEKKELATEALEAISEVITTLSEENEYNPVTVLGVPMSEEIINSLIGLLFMLGSAVLSKSLNIDLPF